MANRKERKKRARNNPGVVSPIPVINLEPFLQNLSKTFTRQEDVQLKRLVDFFGRAFTGSIAPQSMQVKMFGEGCVAKIADWPVCYITDAVYKTSVDWISQLSSYWNLEKFVIWSLDSFLAYMETPQGGQLPMSPESQAAVFLVLALVLRRKPNAMLILMPKLMEKNSKYQGIVTHQIVIWMMVQASHEDLAAGLLMWSDYLLPFLSGQLRSSPRLRDIVLQPVERILAAPRARDILVNNTVRKNCRLISPKSLDLLLHLTFPAPSARVEETERFEQIYPTLKDVAFAGDPKCSLTNQATQRIQIIAIKAIVEGIPALSEEATSIFLWTLTQNRECYLLWEMRYVRDIEASVAVLRKLLSKWKQHSPKLYSLEVLTTTLKRFRQKNEKALTGGVNTSGRCLFKESDKYCKAILWKVTRGQIFQLTACSTFVILFAVAEILFYRWLHGIL